MKCSHCRFWNYTGERSIGDRNEFIQEQCRRHAPTLSTDAFPVATWPSTTGADFCGDFEVFPEFRRCETCGDPVGKTPHATPGLKYCVQYPICKKCFDQFTDGTHPFLKKEGQPA